MVDFPTATLPAIPITNGTGCDRPPEKGVGHPEKLLACLDLEADQPGERHIDVGHLLERHPFVDTAQLLEVGLGETQR